MPLPRLLRKFSQPNLARRSPSSDDSNRAPTKQRRQLSVKPTPTDDRAGSSSPATSKVELESLASGVEMRENPLPMSHPAAGPNVYLTNLSMAPDTEMMPVLNPVSDILSEAWDAVKGGSKDSNMNRRLNTVDDEVAMVQTNIAPFTSPIITAAGAVVQRGVDKFFEGMPVFMNALDAVADLHPFIGVVVLAFKAVYTLELKRRDNDSKVIALYVEMKDMMGVLLLLKDVQDDQLIAPDGSNIADRLRSLVERTAEDIKLCSNVCDTYAKKKLLAKVFQGPLWDNKLLSYVTLFSKRRQEFEFGLSIHTSRGIASANAKLDTIGDQTGALDRKMNILIAMFQQLVSPEQKQLSELVDAKGGVKIFWNDDKMLLSLEETASKVSGTPSAEGHRAQRGKATDPNRNADDLRNDIFEEPDAAVEKNRMVFFRKFEVQKRQIIDELTLVVKRESDRVIQEVKGGPHERILDRSIHEIWKEMGWRGHVKARHFVLALRDYYLEKLASETSAVRGLSTATANDSQNPDAWAIKSIDVMRLQPILEAFNDDASGFITITEMNHFTSSRPVDWSLPEWVAFWAIGYRSSIIDYANKIEILFAKMEGVRVEVLPPNREPIDDYFTYVWEPIHTLIAAVLELSPWPNNPENFRSYLEAEEARLSDNLKAVDYTIDGTDTLTLITGVGRIEKTVFPLLYLLMRRHYEIMRIMRTKVLDSRELWYSVESMLFVKDAIRYRANDLANIFSQQKLDPEKQFQNFAYGIFKYFHDGKALWSVNYVRDLDPPVIPYNDASEDQNVKPEDILKYEYTDELALDSWVYDGHSTEDIPSYRDVKPPLKDILGHWHGYFYEDDGIRETSGTDTMMTFVLEPADGEQDFKANAWSNRRRYTISGSWSKGENDVLQIKFKMSFQSAIWAAIFFNGWFNPDRDALTGVWGMSADPDDSAGPMEFRRIPPRYLAVYPSIKELSDNKPRSLWRFAIAAVRGDIRRDRWSWSYFSQRRDDRETVISLTVRSHHFGTPLNEEEIQRVCATAQRLTPADACFYGSQINRICAYTWVHQNAWCDSCRGCIGGARLFCLDCANKDTEVYDALDLCCAPQCITARVTYREDIDGAHEPNHKLVKVRTVVLKRQQGHVYTAARAAFERVEDFCEKIAEFSKRPQKSDAGLDEPNALSSRAITGTSTQDSDLPTCGKCNGPLSFPCWYCIICQDDLFICDACDADGVPDLMRSSGKHTEEHHLIRCLAPDEDRETASSTEQRLISLEERLDDMQTRFDDFSNRIQILSSSFTG
ncbi:hypothetical protein BJV78DRAFT_1347821 [Lactifluus subvellereus]|nr:hypothetical protein BJV78DRAFT_1347821 [Lactifluus subvellereus]